MSATYLSGGCQCGAVRYRAARLGRASICHCRMCQKAFGNFFAPLVTANELVWTRGAPSYFQSSNKVRRGFCSNCGTPLTYDWGGAEEIAIATLDEPEKAPPIVQISHETRLSFFDRLHELPVRALAEDNAAAKFMAGIVSHQHPDRDTESWPQQGSA